MCSYSINYICLFKICLIVYLLNCLKHLQFNSLTRKQFHIKKEQVYMLINCIINLFLYRADVNLGSENAMFETMAKKQTYSGAMAQNSEIHSIHTNNPFQTFK